ncbi:bacteriocin [Ferruginibacter sp.]|nr:bacteriocin [Ferruginibacter sp.]
MKYKDFKVMSQNEMKKIMGGNPPGGGGGDPETCTASACCSGNSTISCTGVGTAGTDCQAIEGNTISVVNCKNANGVWSSQSCSNS